MTNLATTLVPMTVQIMYHRDTAEFRKGESLSRTMRFESFRDAVDWGDAINANLLARAWHVTSVSDPIPGIRGPSFCCYDISEIWDTYDIRCRQLPAPFRWTDKGRTIEKQINERMRAIYAGSRRREDTSYHRAVVEAIYAVAEDQPEN